MSRVVLLIWLFVLLGCRPKEFEVKVNLEEPSKEGISLGMDADFIEQNDSRIVALEAQKFLISELIKSNRDPDELALSLPQPWRAVYLVNLLDSRVLIHSFDDYFRDTPNILYEPTMEDLKYIGAMNHREIFDRVRKVAIQEGSSQRNQTKRFESFEKEYSDLKPTIDEILGTFIKEHPEHYTKMKK